MTKHIWSVLCRSSSVDKITNNISLFDVFERLEVSLAVPKAKEVPKFKKINLPVDYQIVSLWTHDQKKQDKIRIKIIFENPNGVKTNLVNKDLILPPDKKRMRDITKIRGIVLEKSGTYTFRLQAKKGKDKVFQTIVELPVEIVINEN